MSTAAGPTWRDVISDDAIFDFVESLRVEAQYDIGVGQHMALQDLLVLLTARQRFPDSPRDLRTLIGPLLVSTPAEQEDFERRFNEWIDRLAEHPEEAESLVPLATELHEIDSRSRGLKAGIAGAALLALLVATVLLLGRDGGSGGSGGESATDVAIDPLSVRVPEPSAPSTSEGPKEEGGSVTTAQLPSDEPWGPTLSDLLLVLLALSALVLLIAYRRFWGARADRFLERRATDRSPPITRLRISGVQDRIFDRSALLQAARTLRGRIRVTTRDLAVPSTVDATVAHCGRFTPVYGTRPQVPEYLALVDRRCAGDQLARLIDCFLDQLESEGVFVERFSFDSDPRVCFAARDGHHPMLLSELVGRFPSHRLLLFSEGDGLIDPFRGECHLWVESLISLPDAAVLTVQPVQLWAKREAALARAGLQVLPFTERGLAAAVDASLAPAVWNELPERLPHVLPRTLVEDARTWLSADPPEQTEIEECMRALRSYLDTDSYAWLCSCAVYPELRWELTVFLGHRAEVSAELLPLERVVTLVRLPWFRHGFLPDWMRAELLRDLPAGAATRVQESLRFLLLSTLRGPVEAFDLEVANDERGPLKNLWRAIGRRLGQSESPRSPMQDRVFVSFMNRGLALRLPTEVARIVRRVSRRSESVRTPRRETVPAVTSAVFVGVVCGAFGSIGLVGYLPYLLAIALANAYRPARHGNLRPLLEMGACATAWVLMRGWSLWDETFETPTSQQILFETGCIGSAFAIYRASAALAAWTPSNAFAWFAVHLNRVAQSLADRSMPDRWTPNAQRDSAPPSILNLVGVILVLKLPWEPLANLIYSYGTVAPYAVLFACQFLRYLSPQRSVRSWRFSAGLLVVGVPWLTALWPRTDYHVPTVVLSPFAFSALLAVPFLLRKQSFVQAFGDLLDRRLPDRIFDWVWSDRRSMREQLKDRRPLRPTAAELVAGGALVGISTLALAFSFEVIRVTRSDDVLDVVVETIASYPQVLGLAALLLALRWHGLDPRSWVRGASIQIAAIEIAAISIAASVARKESQPGGWGVAWLTLVVLSLAFGLTAGVSDLAKRAALGRFVAAATAFVDRWMPDRLVMPRLLQGKPALAARRYRWLTPATVLVGVLVASAFPESIVSDWNLYNRPLLSFGWAPITVYLTATALSESRRYMRRSHLALTLECLAAMWIFVVAVGLIDGRLNFDVPGIFISLVLSAFWTVPCLFVLAVASSFARRRHPVHRFLIQPLEIIGDHMTVQTIVRALTTEPPSATERTARRPARGRRASRGATVSAGSAALVHESRPATSSGRRRGRS